MSRRNGSTHGSADPIEPSTSQVTKTARATGENKAFPRTIKQALGSKMPLRINRCIIQLKLEESLALTHQRMKCSVFYVIQRESEGKTPNFEGIKAPSKVAPPTPLWYCSSSEMETIANSAYPAASELLAHGLQLKIAERLGSHAYMLEIYLDVGQIINECTRAG